MALAVHTKADGIRGQLSKKKYHHDRSEHTNKDNFRTHAPFLLLHFTHAKEILFQFITCR